MGKWDLLGICVIWGKGEYLGCGFCGDYISNPTESFGTSALGSVVVLDDLGFLVNIIRN